MYQFIPLYSFDYFCEISIAVNVSTDEGNGKKLNLKTEKKDEIGVVVQRWL